jgi:hypothetical protein
MQLALLAVVLLVTIASRCAAVGLRRRCGRHDDRWPADWAATSRAPTARCWHASFMAVPRP